MKKLSRRALLGFTAMVAAALFTGCENDSDDDDDNGGGGGGGGNVVGTWAVTGTGWKSWWRFDNNGTFSVYRDANLQSKHFGGTYNQNGNKVKGDLTNPGVGEGEIDATVSGDSIAIDFIEHWHTPYKHVPLNGTRL